MIFTRRRLLASLGGTAVAGWLAVVWASRMKTYQGPISDHFDGTQFFDPDGSPPKSLGQVLRWQFGGGRERATWPDDVPNAVALNSIIFNTARLLGPALPPEAGVPGRS